MSKPRETPSKFYKVTIEVEVDPAVFLNEEDVADWLQERVDELMPINGLRDSAGCRAIEIPSF